MGSEKGNPAAAAPTSTKPGSDIPTIPVLQSIRTNKSNTSRPDAAISRTATRNSSRSRNAISRNTSRGRCHGGHDGYSVFHADSDSGSDAGHETGQDRRVQMAEEQEAADADEKAESDEDKIKEGQGFIVGFEERDSFDPKLVPKWRKWLIVLILSSCSLCVTCTSSLYTSTYTQIVPEFHTSQIVATLGLSLFVIGLGLGPMILAPMSEFYGRRIVYILSFVFFIIFLLPCALAHNIQTLLVGRFFNGLAGSAFLSVAGGTVGDLFTKTELSGPMMVYTASPFIGPELGPLIGGFINQFTNWRWSFWTLMIWSAVQLGLITLFVPETYKPVLLRQKAIKLRKETGDERWQAPIEKMDRSIPKTVLMSCRRPFELLFLEPMCFNLCLLSALLLGIIYLFFGAFPLVFGKNHGFQLYQVGLAFLGLFFGMLIGIGSNGLWEHAYLRLVRQLEDKTGKKGASEPEFRLPPTVFGAVLVPIGLFGFAWTTYPSVPWIVPIIFSGIFGLGTVWSFSGIFTFLVECYPTYAASALAANSFARSSFAAAFPLFGVQMYNKLGYQWATSLLAFLALAMVPFPYIFFKHGKKLRGHSRFATSA